MAGKAVGDGAQIQHLLGLAEFAQVQHVGVHIAFDLTHRTHHLDAAVAFCRKGAHGEGGCRAAGKAHGDDLVVHHVVVAPVYAPAVGPCAQRVIQLFLGGFIHQHRAGPLVIARTDAAFVIENVDLFRVVGASFLTGAAGKTAVCTAIRRVFRAEPVQRAVGGNAFAGNAHQPADDVHVVAAFCQDHGAGFLRPPPVAAYIAVGIMPVSHVLHRVQGFDTADGASAQQLVQRAVEFGIAQHMAHHHHAVRLMRFFLQCKAFVQQRRNGFFQHKVIALVQRGQRLRHMLAVLRGNDHHIRKARLGQQLFACGKAASGGHAVIRL